MSESSHRAEVQCVECEQFMDPFATFICRSCKRRPLCPTHQDSEFRGLCSTCANGVRRKKLAELQSGLKSLKGFLRLLEFLFIVIAIIFTAQRLMPDLSPPFIWDNFFVKHLYIWGALSAAGFVVLYLVYLGQKNSVRNLMSELDSAVPAVRYRTR